MSTAILNAKIYVRRGEFAQALLVDDAGLIQAVGAEDEIRAAMPEGCAVWDARGRTTVPASTTATCTS